MLRRLVIAGLTGAALAPAAWAAPRRGQDQGAAVIVAALLGLVVVPSAQVVMAVLAPRLTARTAQATRAHKGAVIGIGLGAALATMILVALLSGPGGPRGKALGGLVVFAVWCLCLPGMVGLSRLLGDRAAQLAAPDREQQAHPLLSVSIGALLWAWASLVTIGVVGIACHVFGLGATIYAWARGPALDVARTGPPLAPAALPPAPPPGPAPPAQPGPRPIHDDGGQAF